MRPDFWNVFQMYEYFALNHCPVADFFAEEFSPEDIRGKFVEGTKHLKRRKESGRKPMTYGALFVAILVLLYILHYLVTGEFTF